MWGFLVALISGALMSIQGVFNTEMTKQTSLWVSTGWVQFSAFLVCVLAWIFTGRDSIGGAMCQGKMGMGVKRRYEGMLEKDPENAQARMLIDNWNKAQSHPNKDDVSRIAAATKEALEGISE